MKIPSDVPASELINALRKVFGYELVEQGPGSHRRLVTQIGGTHYLIIPEHHALAPGTLRGILDKVATHQCKTVDEVLVQLVQ